jgi:RNA polymerase sigma-70 factor (ECF subfamily)
VPRRQPRGDSPDRTGVSDHDRFRSAYDANFSRIFAFALRATRADRSEAEDVVAETFAVAWRRIGELPDPPEDRLWLYGVARHVAARSYRSRNRRQRLAERAKREPVVPLGREEPGHVDVRVALDRLPPKEREVLHLLVWEQLSQEETAAVIGCSVNAVRLRLHRARGRLRDRLGEQRADPALSPSLSPASDTNDNIVRINLETP